MRDPSACEGSLKSPPRRAPWAALALLVAVAACGRREAASPPLEIAMRVRPEPLVVGVAAIELDLRDASGAPIRGATVKIEADMTHPGMAPSLADAREAKPGTYRADLELTMAGDWTLQVDAHLASGETARRTLKLPRVRGS